MTRRASLPGAAELFRTTTASTLSEPDPAPAPAPHPGVGAVPAAPLHERAPHDPVPLHDASPLRDASTLREQGSPTPARARVVRTTRRVRRDADRNPSGRERHEEKITVYCSPEELMDLESARLHLRAEHGLAIDRGRMVREAVAVILADLEAKGESSILVRRLRES
jgi:hypothetical protein